MNVEKEDLSCKRCGRHFECKVHTVTQCQCHAIVLRADTLAFLSKTSWGCLCQNCLLEIDEKVESIRGKELPIPKDLKEGIHYYIENGFWVFTELHHMLRGHCCKSGCRHCAYGYKK